MPRVLCFGGHPNIDSGLTRWNTSGLAPYIDGMEALALYGAPLSAARVAAISKPWYRWPLMIRGILTALPSPVAAAGAD